MVMHHTKSDCSAAGFVQRCGTTPRAEAGKRFEGVEGINLNTLGKRVLCHGRKAGGTQSSPYEA